eukprot:TRINITY_DN21077_c0_g1_i1.p1 TRINITY_DN21077_c0_g1~~TRINITY_DN21077_c0_g1_i1.p1  ORF type:complete len:1319 (+),score=377.18 TRINITY_DN21077_c0_g1_i1:30-3959(+)
MGGPLMRLLLAIQCVLVTGVLGDAEWAWSVLLRFEDGGVRACDQILVGDGPVTSGVYEAVRELDGWKGLVGRRKPEDVDVECVAVSGVRVGKRVRNPLLRIEEGEHEEHHGHMKGRYIAHTYGILNIIIVPSMCAYMEVYGLSTTPLRIDAPVPPSTQQVRTAPTLQTSTIIEHNNAQVVGPASVTNNLVIMSAGYTEAEKSIFERDVDHVMQLFKFPPISGYKDSIPFYRYFDAVNVFTVWQPASQSGASKPAQGLTVLDNLGCEYGKTNPRYLFCDVQKALNLAETSPAKPRTANKDNTVMAILVNDGEYGGGGMFSTTARLACFYNGFNYDDSGERTKFGSLLYHELGHAWGDLFDEYDMLITEPTVIPLKNCVSPLSPTIPWQGWIDKAKTDSSLGILQTPVTPCGYTNYLKPSQNCIMSKLTDGRMCPVCREAVSLQMYRSKLSLLWPSCPLPDEIVYLPSGGSIVLHLNAKLLSKGMFTVSWTRKGAALCAQGACEPSLEVKASDLDMGDNTITATIADMSDWVLGTSRLADMTQSRDFTIKVVAAINNASGTLRSWKCYCTDESLPECRGGPLFFQAPLTTDTGYVAECKDNGTCTLNFTTSTYDNSNDGTIDNALQSYESYVLYLGIAAGVAALMLWVKAWTRWRHKMNGRVRPIFRIDFKRKYVVIRNIMMVTAILIMILSMATLGVALYLYTQFDGLGKWLLVPGGVAALILYIIAFLGFWAAWYRSKYLLGVNGVVLILCLGIIITIAYFAKWFADGVGDSGHSASKFLKDTWEHIVENYPARACAIEQLLHCSGYEENCQRMTSTVSCPDNCDSTNAKYSDACKVSIEDKIKTYCPRVFTYSIVVGVCLFIGIIFNFVLCYALREMEKELKDKAAKKLQKQPAPMPPPQTAAATTAGTMPDTAEKNVNSSQNLTNDYRGTVTGNRTVSLLKGLNSEEKARLTQEFNRFDKRGDGTVDRREFKKFMHRAFGFEPTSFETDQVFLAAGGQDRIRFNEVLHALGGEQSGYQGLLQEQRERAIMRNFEALENGELPEPPPEYHDEPSLPAGERHRRWELREEFNKGVNYGLNPESHRVLEVDMTRANLGLDYDTNPDVGVTAVSVSGPAKDAGIRPGDVITGFDGIVVRSAGDLQAGFRQARAKGLKIATVTTRQQVGGGLVGSPALSSLAESPRGLAPGYAPPEWATEAFKVSRAFVAGGLGVGESTAETLPSSSLMQRGNSTAMSRPPHRPSPPPALPTYVPPASQTTHTTNFRKYGAPRYIHHPSPSAPPAYPTTFTSPYITNPHYAAANATYSPILL